MSISEQVSTLNELAELQNIPYHKRIIKRAADTIESLSAKLQAANEELERWHTDHINENIKNPFAWTSTLICHNCDHKDEYIEELEAEVEELKAANMERTAEDCGGWIPCNVENIPDKEVLCCDNHGEMILGYIFEDETSDTGFSAENDHEYMYGCVKWMEKPKS